MTDNQQRILSLCALAKIVAMNDDVDDGEKRALSSLANEVQKIVVDEINANRSQ